uniref:Uncharacterized protein n=1 Tax=Sphaerodactylus townsendi TaxID=933632 RepID=A0ACB8G6M7_9SAUR
MIRLLLSDFGVDQCCYQQLKDVGSKISQAEGGNCWEKNVGVRELQGIGMSLIFSPVSAPRALDCNDIIKHSLGTYSATLSRTLLSKSMVLVAAMTRRLLKLVSLASVAAASTGFYLYSNNPLDPNDFGVVRVGRAVATTAVITYDYFFSLRSIPYGTEEYDNVKSQLGRNVTSLPAEERAMVFFCLAGILGFEKYSQWSVQDFDL